MTATQNMPKTIELLRAGFEGQRLAELTPHDQNTLALCSMAEAMVNEKTAAIAELAAFRKVVGQQLDMLERIIVRGLTRDGDRF